MAAPFVGIPLVRNERNETPMNLPVKSYYSSFDVLRIGNALTPASSVGQQTSLGSAGSHGMVGVCKAIGC